VNRRTPEHIDRTRPTIVRIDVGAGRAWCPRCDLETQSREPVALLAFADSHPPECKGRPFERLPPREIPATRREPSLKQGDGPRGLASAPWRPR
jgi:hypothetical protein